jgi:hypothetical protein
MRHYDYDWDLEPWGITFDPELDIDKLGWQGGDYFKITNVNGKSMLLKVDPVEAFARGHAVNKRIEGHIK